MKGRLLDYIKIGFGFYIGYSIAKALDEKFGVAYKQSKTE